MAVRRNKLSALAKELNKGAVTIELCNMGAGGEYFQLRNADKKVICLIKADDLFDGAGNRFDY